MIEIKDEDVVKDMTVYKNLSQDVIITTTDKVELLLNEHHKAVRKKVDWLTPLGVFVTILIAFLTANFDKTFLSIDAPTWRAIFIISSVLSFAYTVYSIVVALSYRGEGTVSGFIQKLKSSSIDTKVRI